MTRPDLDRTIQSLVKCIELAEQHHRCEAAQRGQVVTVSTGEGAGGERMARLLAKRLAVPFYDKEILDAVAKRSHVSPHALERLDERVDGLKGAWLRALFTGEDIFKETYCRDLISVVLTIACKGGVLLGRGANLILSHQPVLRVRVVGSFDVCAQRIAEAEGIEAAAAEARIKSRDQERREFLEVFFKHDIDDPRGYDLIINSDRFGATAMVEMVSQAMDYAALASVAASQA